MQLKGEKIILLPIQTAEKNKFRTMVTQSEASFFWYGKAGDTRTKKEFFTHWYSDYFNENTPKNGQCFWIIANNKRIGEINYNKIEIKGRKVEIDIFIASTKDQGSGYGSNAIKTLIKYLFETFDLNKIWVEIRAFNIRAIAVFKKVGFKQEGILREEDYFDDKFIDCVRLGLLKKEFNK